MNLECFFSRMAGKNTRVFKTEDYCLETEISSEWKNESCCNGLCSQWSW